MYLTYLRFSTGRQLGAAGVGGEYAKLSQDVPDVGAEAESTGSS